MAASLSGFAAISQTFSRSNEREQKDRITSLPLPSPRSSLFSLSPSPISSLPSLSVEFLWELSDIHICLLLHQKFQPRPVQPTSSPLSYKGFAATYDISLPSYLPIHLPLSYPPLLSTPPTPSSSSSYYVINARKLSLSLFFSLSTICPLWKKGEPLNVSFSPLPPSLSPHLCHFRSVQFFFTHPSNASFSVPSGVSSPIWINEPTLFPSSTSNCPSIRPVRDSPRNEPLYVYIYSTGICEILFPSFFPPPFFLLFLSYFLILVFLSGSLVFSGVPFFH